VQRSVESRRLGSRSGTGCTTLGCYVLESGTVAAGCAILASWAIARTSKVSAQCNGDQAQDVQ
jgi:hypothetical protein